MRFGGGGFERFFWGAENRGCLGGGGLAGRGGRWSAAGGALAVDLLVLFSVFGGGGMGMLCSEVRADGALTKWRLERPQLVSGTDGKTPWSAAEEGRRLPACSTERKGERFGAGERLKHRGTVLGRAQSFIQFIIQLYIIFPFSS